MNETLKKIRVGSLRSGNTFTTCLTNRQGLVVLDDAVEGEQAPEGVRVGLCPPHVAVGLPGDDVEGLPALEHFFPESKHLHHDVVVVEGWAAPKVGV